MTSTPDRGELPEPKRILAAWLGGAATLPAWDSFTRELPPDLLPFAHHRLSVEGYLERAPRGLVSLLRNAARSNAALQLGHRAELISAVQALDAADIPCLALKGMALAHDVYPRPDTRVMVDVDVGVPIDRLREARRVLEATGLRVPQRRARDEREAGDEWEGPLERPGSSRMVDLHGCIKIAQPPYSSEVVKEPLSDPHWERAVTLSIGGQSVRALAPQDGLRHTLLHLACMHGFQHGMRSLLDVALIAQRHGASLDWQALREACGELSPWVGLTLALVQEDLGTPVEPGGIERFSPAGVPLEAKRLAREQLWESHGVHAPVGLLDLLAGERGWLWPKAKSDPSRSVGGAGRRTGMDDVRRRLTVLGRNLKQGQLTPRRLVRAVGLRRGHWRLVDLMRSDR